MHVPLSGAKPRHRLDSPGAPAHRLRQNAMGSRRSVASWPHSRHSEAARRAKTAIPVKDTELAQHIERLVETFLTSDDGKEAAALSEAQLIYEREGIPTVAKVGDAAAYGFVLVNMLGQPPEFQAKFLERVRDAATRHELPEDAVAFAEARLRQTEVEERYKAHLPSNPELRDEISRLFKDDQAVREREGFDAKKTVEADRRTAGPLKAIFDSIRRADLRHGGCAGGEGLRGHGSASVARVSPRSVAEVEGQR